MRRRHVVLLAGILFVALALRGGVVLATTDYRPVSDDFDYDRHAVSLVDFHSYAPPFTVAGGGEASAFRPPLYPFSLAAVYALAGTDDAQRSWDAGRLAQAILGTVAVALIAIVAWLLAGSTVGLVAGAIASVFPPFLMLSAALLSENLFICCELGAVTAVLLYRRGERHRRWLVLAGVCAGLAWLTRGNGVVLAVPLALGAWSTVPRLSLRALAPPGILIVAMALTVAPWTVRNLVALDAFVPVSTQTGLGVAGQYNDTVQNASPPAQWRPAYELPEFADAFRARPPLGEVAIDRRLRRAAREYVLDHPLAPLEVAWWNGRRLLALDGTRTERINARAVGISSRLSDVSLLGFLILAPLALVGAFTATARCRSQWIWLIPVLLLLSAVFVSGTQRYRTPADPYFILLAAMALCALGTRARASRAVAR